MPECDKGVGIDDLSVAYSAMLRRPCPAIATLAVDWCLQFDVTPHVHRPAVASTPRRTIERAAPITPRSTRLDSNLFDFVPPKWCDKASQDTRDKIIAALAAMEVYTIGDLLAVEACGKSSMIKRLEDALGLVQDGIEAHRGIQFMNYVDLIKNLQQAVPPPRPTIVGKDVIRVGAPMPCSANRLVLNALSCCAAGELLPRVTTVFKRPDYQVTESEGEGARVWHVKLNVCALNDGRRTVKTVTAGLVTDANQSIIAIPLDKKTHEPRPFTDKQAKSAGTCQAMAWAVYYDADKYHQNPNKQMADVATLNVNISML